MDIFEICKTLKSLEANEDEILGSLENLKRLLEEKRNSISLRLSLLREDVLRCMVGMLRCYHGDDNILLIVLECIDLAAHGCDQLRQNLSDLGLVTVIMNLLQQDSLKKSSNYLKIQESLVSVVRKATSDCQPGHASSVSDGGIKMFLRLLNEQYSLSIDSYPRNTKDRLTKLTVGNCFIAAVNRVPSAIKASLCHLFPCLSALGEEFIQQYPLFLVDLSDMNECFITDTLVNEELALYDNEQSLMSSKNDNIMWVIVRVTHVSGPVQVWAEFSVDKKTKEQWDCFETFHKGAPPEPSVALPPTLTLGSVYSVYNSISSNPDIPVGWYRGWLVNISHSSSNKTIYEFFCMDYGFNVRCTGKRYTRQLPPQFKGVPPRVAPCVLAGIKPPVKSVRVLEDCCGILRNLSFDGDVYHRHFLSQRVGPFLLELISSKSVTVEALGHILICLMNLTQLNDTGLQIQELGGIQTLTDILLNFTDNLDLSIHKCLLQCLSNLLLLDKDSLKTFRMINGPTNLREWTKKHDHEIEKCVHVLLDSLESKKGKVVERDQSMFSSLIATTNNISPLRKNQSPKTPSNTTKNVASKASPVYRLQTKDNGSSHMTEELMKRLPAISVPPVLYRSQLVTTPTHAYEYINVERISDISSGHILRSMCALANGGVEGTIYIGITDNGRVKGVRLSRNQRDNIRVDVDKLLTQLKPPIVSARFNMTFIPVINSPRNGDQFVVAIKIIPSSSKAVHVFQKKNGKGQESQEECYIHRNGRSIKMSILDVREMVAEQMFQKQLGGSMSSP